MTAAARELLRQIETVRAALEQRGDLTEEDESEIAELIADLRIEAAEMGAE